MNIKWMIILNIFNWACNVLSVNRIWNFHWNLDAIPYYDLAGCPAGLEKRFRIKKIPSSYYVYGYILKVAEYYVSKILFGLIINFYDDRLYSE